MLPWTIKMCRLFKSARYLNSLPPKVLQHFFDGRWIYHRPTCCLKKKYYLKIVEAWVWKKIFEETWEHLRFRGIWKSQKTKTIKRHFLFDKHQNEQQQTLQDHCQRDGNFSQKLHFCHKFYTFLFAYNTNWHFHTGKKTKIGSHWHSIWSCYQLFLLTQLLMSVRQRGLRWEGFSSWRERERGRGGAGVVTALDQKQKKNDKSSPSM